MLITNKDCFPFFVARNGINFSRPQPFTNESHTQTANTCNLEEMKDHSSFVCNVDIYETKT